MSATDPSPGEAIPNTIDVALPLRAEHAGTLRVLVATLGADAGFNIDEIDDLKLAVSEIFTLLVDGAASVGAFRAHARIIATDDTVEICLHRGQQNDHLELDALAATILSSVVDDHHIDGDGVTLVKHRHESLA
jgi:hypothetical protein